MNFQYWLNKAINKLSNSGSKTPRRDAETLLKFVTGKTYAFLIAFNETLLTTEQEIQLDKLLSRRKAGEPMAYILGECEFWSLPIYVSAVTMIPRQDTECLVEQALARLSTRSNCNILDLGTGTGAIALAIASERSDCNVIAIDFISSVVELARHNAKRLAVPNVKILQSYWFDSLYGQKFDMIVSNPPYINSCDIHLLHGDVRFEPLTALVAADNGLAELSYIILHASNYLVPGGWLLVEHGWTQGTIIKSKFALAGFQSIKTYCDYGGNDRITIGKLL